jgi:hypothetical protein
MADYEGERIWDEFQWERFLQQQDKKTEKYMELLEKYLDDPRRDEIIAREMGWTHYLEEKEWADEADAFATEDWRSDEYSVTEAEQLTDIPETFEDHPLYRAAFGLTVWIDQLFDEQTVLQNDPVAVKLATHTALASAKLAAALNDEDGEELGMTIAYLKRALKAITTSMDAAAQLLSKKLINPAQHDTLEAQLFQIRDGIINLMGEYRSEWRRRFGSEGYRS